MTMPRKRRTVVRMAFSVLLVCSHHSAFATDNVFRETTPHAPPPGPYHHTSNAKELRPNGGNPATPLDGHAAGHYLFFHPKQIRQNNAGSSTSSSEKGKTDTTSDSKPSSTDDSSFKAQEEESSTSSSVKGKTDTTSDSKPSSTNDSSFKNQGDSEDETQSNQGDSEDETQSSGSSTPKDESDNTSDSKPSSTDDSSMNEDGEGDEEQSEETPTTEGKKSESCQVASNGNFGATTSGGRGLQFFFQMETPESVNENLVNDVLLPIVELGIAGRLLSLLFNDCRNITSRSLLRRRSLQTTNSSCEAIGYSNLPVDRVLTGVPCVGQDDDSSNNCFVIDAGARIYLDSGTSCPDAANRSKAELKKAMDSGAFNSLERRILNVTYVEESDLELTSNDKTVQSSEGSDDSEILPAWSWALIAVGGFFVILMCCYLCLIKRNPKPDHDDEMRTPLGHGDDGDIDYEPPHSEHENPYYDSETRQSEDSDPPGRTTDDDSMLPPMEETSGEDSD